MDSIGATGLGGVGRHPCWFAAAYIINYRGIEKLTNQKSLILKPDLETKESEWVLSYVADNYIYGLTTSYMCRTPSFLCLDEGSSLGHDGFISGIFEANATGQAKEYRDSIIRDIVAKVESQKKGLDKK